MNRRFVSLACALLLIFAQHGSIAHAIWHAQHDRWHQDSVACEDAHAGERDAEHETARLCAFDLAFSQVLGGACMGTYAVPLEDTCVDARALSLDTLLPARFLAPLSRGPPILL